MKHFLRILTFCLVCLCGRPAIGQTIDFDLSLNQSVVHPGDLVSFFATVHNPGPADVMLDSLTATFLPDLARDEDFTPFFDNFAGLLVAGGSVPDSGSPLEIYALRILASAPLGTYNGSLAINDPNGVTLASADFTLEVEAGLVPETSALPLFVVGICVCLMLLPWGWKQKARKRYEGVGKQSARRPVSG